MSEETGLASSHSCPAISIDDFRFFSVIAISRSLAAAGRALDVTSPAVTQRLHHIEAKLGVRLVDRSTRHLNLTAEGELLATRGRVILGEVDDLVETLSGRTGAVAGHLRVAAPFGFGRRFVEPAATRFRIAYPDTALTLDLLENPAGDRATPWDVVVHLGELHDSSLQMQMLAHNARVVCAAPDYLRKKGTPCVPADLAGHPCVALRENGEDATLWRFTNRSGGVEAVRVRPAMASNDGEVVRSWGLAGFGIILRSEWDVADDLRVGRLIRILPDWLPPAADVVALLPSRRGRTARTSRFLSILQQVLTPPPWQN